MRFVIFLVMILVSSTVFADVVAEVLSYKIDQNGNIEVHTQYKIDGVEVPSRYPLEDGKHYLVTRYQANSFGSMTNDQIKQRILKEIEEHAKSLTQEGFIKKANQDIMDNKLGSLVGSKVLITDAEIGVDNDGDNKIDKVWTVNTKGEKLSEKNP